MLRLSRVLAIVIGMAAVIDPPVTTLRRARPALVVFAVSPMHEPLALRVARSLSDDFTVLRDPFVGAAATVLVGDAIPPAARAAGTPVFSVLPAPNTTIRALTSPDRVHLDSRGRVTVTLTGDGIADVSLAVNGNVVDRTSVTVTDSVTVVHLSFAPTAAGPALLHVQAGSAGVDAIVDVRTDRSRVFFYDARPSWMSTFVRRAVERDTRFEVVSRAVVSTSISSATGAAPASLSAGIHEFDVVVIGAPEALTQADVVALEDFMRRRGGVVLLLPDNSGRGPYNALPGADTDSESASAARMIRLDGDSVTLRTAEIMRPRSDDALTGTVAFDTTGRPVVWRSAVGAGTMWISGALDAWRFRDPAVSQFDRFWQAVMARAAADAQPPVSISVSPSVLQPGEMADVTITVRDASLTESSPVRATARAEFGGQTLRPWATGAPGVFRARLRAPRDSGEFRIAAHTDNGDAESFVAVRPTVSRTVSSTTVASEVWANSRGGVTVPSSQLDRLPGLLERTVTPAAARMTWYPMRSPWWIAPFTLLLGTEWWLRRRRGLA